MELRRYLELSRRWWWLIGVAFLATTAVTAASVASQTATYESSATFLVRPRSGDAPQDARAFDPLVRGVTINTTYASIARSGLIRDRAEAQLDPEARADDMTVGAKVLTDTNIVSVSVRGPDADHVLALARAISAETVEYVNGLSDVYVLQSLDEPERAESPVGTDRTLTIAIGAVLGLTLGLGLALLVEHLWTKTPWAPGAAAARRRQAPSPGEGAAVTEREDLPTSITRDPTRDDRVGARGPRHAGPADPADRGNGEPDRPS